MKKIVVTFCLLSSCVLFSQNANSSLSQERQQQEMEKARQESIEKSVAQLKEELNLNELQVIAIKQIYAESVKKQGIILKKEITNDEKTEALKSLTETSEKKILDLLDAPQKERYNQLKLEKNSGQSKKKKKKDKKSEE